MDLRAVLAAIADEVRWIVAVVDAAIAVRLEIAARIVAAIAAWTVVIAAWTVVIAASIEVVTVAWIAEVAIAAWTEAVIAAWTEAVIVAVPGTGGLGDVSIVAAGPASAVAVQAQLSSGLDFVRAGPFPGLVRGRGRVGGDSSKNPS